MYLVDDFISLQMVLWIFVKGLGEEIVNFPLNNFDNEKGIMRIKTYCILN